MPWEEVRKVCLDYTVTGLSITSQLTRDSKSPFRFIYVSGSSAERDQSKKPMLLGDYLLMRVSAFFSFDSSIRVRLNMCKLRGKLRQRYLILRKTRKGRWRHV
jgi:hypothetical protein